MLFRVVLFCTAPATTEFYTTSHTLCRIDVLPVGVQVVSELTHGANQSSPCLRFVGVSPAGPLDAASSACLRSAIVWRRCASPRERAARPRSATTGARNSALPR